MMILLYVPLHNSYPFGVKKGKAEVAREPVKVFLLL